jgi:hypothetical protein
MGSTERIIQYLEYKGISKYKFCKDLGFSNKFLDNSSNMGTDKACKILHYFPEMSAEWLLTGEGNKLKNKVENGENEVENERSRNEIEKLIEENASLKEKNDLLRFKLAVLEKLVPKNDYPIVECKSYMSVAEPEPKSIKKDPKKK